MNDSFIRPDAFWRNLGLRAQQKVVHLGCGAGFYLLPAAHIVGAKGKAYGFDILPDMLAEVENKAKRENLEDIVSTKRANLEQVGGSGLPDNDIDWVLTANILHQSDPEKIFQEAARIVSTSGRVVVVEWDTGATPFGPPSEARRPKNDVIQFAQNANLSVEKEFKPSPYHYGLILKKS
ncbi:MAG: methyltransferase domain-containing protein [Candidatus Andersenbacteria bacterium]|nr:methyltransferase domain-containing protein [Candidatus Andersenbacteria bacterium]MBI3250672.1 methyltransferase domain-containing protein [Candidatus Andersenbacteria bacterium]